MFTRKYQDQSASHRNHRETAENKEVSRPQTKEVLKVPAQTHTAPLHAEETEDQFVPDYEEEPHQVNKENRSYTYTSNQLQPNHCNQPSYTEMIQQMKQQLIEPLCQQLQESIVILPAAMMTSIGSVASVYRTSNSNLLDLTKKLDTSTSQQHASFQASQTLN